MFKWITQFQNATNQTKQFFFHAFLYSVLILGIFVYAYVRLISLHELHPQINHQEQ